MSYMHHIFPFFVARPCQIKVKWTNNKFTTCWTTIPPDGGGGGVSSDSHLVVSLWDLLGPVRMQPCHRGHVACVHHGHDPVLDTQLTNRRSRENLQNLQVYIQWCFGLDQVLSRVEAVMLSKGHTHTQQTPLFNNLSNISILYRKHTQGDLSSQITSQPSLAC